MLACASNPEFGGCVIRCVDDETVTGLVICCLHNHSKALQAVLLAMTGDVVGAVRQAQISHDTCCKLPVILK